MGAGQRADAVFHGRHAARREALADDRPHTGVSRRVHGEERHGPVRVGPEGGRVETDPVGVRVVVDVAEGRQHIGVARVGEEVQLLVVEDGGFGAQPGVRRVRVLVDAVVVGAVGQRRHGRHDDARRRRRRCHQCGGLGHQRRHGVEGQVAHAGAQQGTGVGDLQHVEHGHVDPRAQRGRQPARDLGAQPRAHTLDVGAVARAAPSCRRPRPASPWRRNPWCGRSRPRGRAATASGRPGSGRPACAATAPRPEDGPCRRNTCTPSPAPVPPAWRSSAPRCRRTVAPRPRRRPPR